MITVFEVDDGPLVLQPLDMISVALDQLGEHVTTPAEHS